MTITVTQDDIDSGRPRSCSSCPVAIAIKRKHPRSRDVSVGLMIIISYKTRSPRVLQVPYVASRFMFHFDLDSPVHPFTFELA